MDNLILNPTSTAQWYALVNEAEAKCALELGEDLESYLVFLLMRFSGKPEMVASVFALEFLNSQHVHGSFRNEMLKELGDKCLLFSGFFPEQTKKKRVQEAYFIDLGQNAYHEVASLSEQELIARLYYSLSAQFTLMRDVILAMRKENEALPQLLTKYLQDFHTH